MSHGLLGLLDEGADGGVKADATVDVVVVVALDPQSGLQRANLVALIVWTFLKHPSVLVGQGPMPAVIAEPQKDEDGRQSLLGHDHLARSGHALSVFVCDPLVEPGLFVEQLRLVPTIVATETGKLSLFLLV